MIRLVQYVLGYVNIRIGDLFEFKNGINKDKGSFGSGSPIINYIDVYKNKKIINNTLKGRVIANKSDISRYSCKRGDVFFTRTSETKEEIGFASVLTEDIDSCVFSGFLLRARPMTDLLLPEYCAYCFSSTNVRNKIIRYSNYTTRCTITGAILSDIYIPLPPLEEQQRIVDILDKFEKLTNDITEGLPAEIKYRQQQYEYYRDMLLNFNKIEN